MAFSERGGPDLPAAFYLIKKYIYHSQSYRWSKVSAMRISIVICKRDFDTRFAANHQFKIYLLLQFLSDHPQHFRICSWHKNKENDRTKFCIMPSAFKLK